MGNTRHTELADGAVLPARIVLEDKAFDRMVESLERPAAPTKQLRELMGGKDGVRNDRR